MNLVGHTGRIQRWVAILLVTSAFVGCIGGEDIGLDRWTTDPANPERVQHYDGTGNLADRVPEQVGETVHELTGYQGAEPTTGITDSGAVFGTAGDQLIRSTDHGETWEVVNEIGEEVEGTPADVAYRSWDPLMYVDDLTDTVYFDPMFPPLACTELQSSTDDGETWTQHPPACHPPPMDHQKFFTAKPGPEAPPQAGLAHATVLYQCYNAVSSTNCAASYDGGQTWPVVHPVADSLTGECGGINGFGEGSPEGVAVVALQAGCQQATIAVTMDSGLSWELRKVPWETGVASFDPEVGFDDEGNLYLVWRGEDQLSYLAKSPDLGQTWQGPWDVTPPSVASTIFNTLTVTDAGELGIGFLGTEDTDAGPDQAPEDARWHLYNVVSLDQGTGSPTFTSHQVTPDEDPVQVGRICTGGVGCGEKRNLLEFIDNDVHPDGTLYTIYTEGCVDDCAEDPDGEKSTAREIAWARLDGVTFTTDEASQGDEPALDTAPGLARPR
jgi:hypothetical protein